MRIILVALIATLFAKPSPALADGGAFLKTLTNPCRSLSEAGDEGDKVSLDGLIPHHSKPFQPDDSDYSACAFSDDGALLAVGGLRWSRPDESHPSVRVWNVNEANAPRRIDLTADADSYIIFVGFLPNSRGLVTGSYTHRDATIESQIHFWDLGTGKEKRRIRFAETNLGAMALSNDGQSLAIAADRSGSQIILMDSDGKVREKFDGHGDLVRSLGFSPDGAFLISSGGDGTVRSRDLRNGRNLRELKTKNGTTMVAISPSAKEPIVAVAGDKDAEIIIWNYQTGQRIRSIKGRIESSVAMAFSADARYLVTAGGLSLHVKPGKPIEPPITSDGGPQILVWETQTGVVVSSILGFRSEVHAIACSRSGDLAIGDTAGKLKLWRMARESPSKGIR
jgi:hypothetical protein